MRPLLAGSIEDSFFFGLLVGLLFPVFPLLALTFAETTSTSIIVRIRRSRKITFYSVFLIVIPRRADRKIFLLLYSFNFAFCHWLYDSRLFVGHFHSMKSVTVRLDDGSPSAARILKYCISISQSHSKIQCRVATLRQTRNLHLLLQCCLVFWQYHPQSSSKAWTRAGPSHPCPRTPP